MATNDFIGFASSGSANIMSQADFAAAAEQTDGVQSGPASSSLANKIWRQGANMAAALGAMIAAQGNNALDDGDIGTLQAALEASVQGRKRATFALTADTSDPNLSITVGTERNYICGNIIQISTQFTFSGTVTTGWTTLATADLTALTALRSAEYYTVIPEHIGSASATTRRDRIVFLGMTSGVFRIRAYLYAGDHTLDLRPSGTLVCLL